MDKFIGKTLNDRYILTEIVGVGGMAVVYKAFDQVVNRIVAVKILKEEFMSDAQFRRRFSNESKAITMLSQNNIVDVYDVCLEGDLMYLVMEYIDGITLKEYIDKVKVLDWHEAAFYIKQILKAMSHAHERGIVHRDLKPHNIMLLRDGTIKVTDFGIAKLSKFDTQTITDKAIGSVHYISPEQASGDRTDEKTDIYSVGVMFYEMLTGTLPFVGDSAVSVALMQVQAQPKLPREINDAIPEGIEEITIKAMMKDPATRYDSALSMFNDILKVEENDSINFGYLYSDDNDEQEVEEELTDNSPTQFVDLSKLSDYDSTYDKAEVIDDEEETEEPDEEAEEDKFKSTWLPIICGIGSAFLVVFLTVFGIIYFPEITDKVTTAATPVEEVTLQNYVGQDYETVVNANTTGLIFSRENVTSDQKAGTILSQDPAANSVLKKGTEVVFKVSIGAETVTVPDLSNKHSTLAFSELYTQGILYKTKYISSESVKEDYVVRTDPSAGTEVTSDTTITVYISSGSAIVTKDVPDLLNRSEEDAVEKLSVAGLKADKKYQYSDTVPKGCVISQSPEAGAKVDEGSSVVIEISLGSNTEVEDPNEDDNPQNPDDTLPDDGENPDNPENPGDNGDGNIDNGGEETPPADDNPPVEVEMVQFSKELDLTPYITADTQTIKLLFSTDSTAWNEEVSVAAITANGNKYTTAVKELPKGTVVAIYAGEQLINNYVA